MELSLFDLHCDTATAIYDKNESLLQNTCGVSLLKASPFARYAQVMAIWTDPRYSDGEGWERLQAVLAYLQNDPSLIRGDARLCHTCPPSVEPSTALFLAVEDARILEGQMDRIDILYDLGFCILTPLWGGVSCIGGAHDTSMGLTEFGKNALSKAASKGMILDISHASEKSTDEIFSIASDLHSPVMASHSNVYELTPVSRNLKEKSIKTLFSLGGIIGINLHEPFLSHSCAGVDDVLRHIDAILELGGEKRLCLGADMDGGRMPHEFSNISMLPRLSRAMQKQNYSDELIENIFFENADRFFHTHLNQSNTKEGT